MKNHTKVYLNHFNLSGEEYVFCEFTGKKATDIHHLNRRGMGGSKTKDTIENLFACTREMHDLCEKHPAVNEYAKQIHKSFLEVNPYNTPTDVNWQVIWKTIQMKINILIR